MSLAYEHRQNPDHPRTALVHGFAQNRRCWGAFVDCLVSEQDLILIDAPGHGESAHDHADLIEAANLIGDVAAKAHYVGYSMGGRMSLHVALENPALVESLVLISATAGIRDDHERDARWMRDHVLAEQIIADGVSVFLDEWVAQPLFSDLSPDMQFRIERASNRAEGMAESLRNCGTGNQTPSWSRLGELTMPTAIVVGDSDTKFRGLGEEMADAMPNAELVVVANAGHAVHLQAPEAVAEVVRRFSGRER